MMLRRAPENSSRYDNLVKAYREAFSNLAKATQYSNAQDIWKRVKNSKEDYATELLRLKQLAAKRKAANLAKWTLFTRPKPTGKHFPILCQQEHS